MCIYNHILYISSIYNINFKYNYKSFAGGRVRRLEVHNADIFISNSGDVPIYEQITSQIKDMIMRGELKGGDALPSMRALAKDLHISVITTKRAYEELERDGFIHTMVGRGSFVADANMEMMKEEKYRKIEEILTEGVRLAKSSGISCEELQEIIQMVYEED